MKIAFVVALACVASASAGGLVGYSPAGTYFSHAPAFDSAVVKSDRIGGNFAYSVQTQHAYAAHTPVVQHVATPVGVSYGAPAYGYARPAGVAIAQPLDQQVAYARPAVAQQVAYARPAVAQQVAYARPAVALSQQVAYSRPAVAVAQPFAQQVAYARPAAYGYAQTAVAQPVALAQPAYGGYAVARPNIEGTINTPRGTIAYSGVGSSGAYNAPIQQVAASYIQRPVVAAPYNNAYSVQSNAGYNTLTNGLGYTNLIR